MKKMIVGGALKKILYWKGMLESRSLCHSEISIVLNIRRISSSSLRSVFLRTLQYKDQAKSLMLLT